MIYNIRIDLNFPEEPNHCTAHVYPPVEIKNAVSGIILKNIVLQNIKYKMEDANEIS